MTKANRDKARGRDNRGSRANGRGYQGRNRDAEH